jgi:hypothetical protein
MAATALVKKEKAGWPAKRRAADELAQELRRIEVARLLMERKNYREILAALNDLPKERRPKNVSLATISRDVQALRVEWVKEQGRGLEEWVAEEVERLNQLEKVWWPLAMTADKEATDRVLAIQRQRAWLLGIGGGRGGVQITAAAAAAGAVKDDGGLLPAGAQVKVLVEYVDDRRDLEKYG